MKRLIIGGHLERQPS